MARSWENAAFVTTMEPASLSPARDEGEWIAPRDLRGCALVAQSAYFAAGEGCGNPMRPGAPLTAAEEGTGQDFASNSVHYHKFCKQSIPCVQYHEYPNIAPSCVHFDPFDKPIVHRFGIRFASGCRCRCCLWN